MAKGLPFRTRIVRGWGGWVPWICVVSAAFNAPWSIPESIGRANAWAGYAARAVGWVHSMSPALSYLLLGATALWVGLWVADRIEMAWKARKQGNAPAGQADPALPSKVQIEEWLAFVKAHKMGWVDTGEVSVGLSYGRTLRYAPEWVEMRPFLSEEAVRLTEYVGPSALVEGSRRPVHIKRLISRDLRVLLRKMDG